MFLSTLIQKAPGFFEEGELARPEKQNHFSANT
jgi:hypothetical protein